MMMTMTSDGFKNGRAAKSRQPIVIAASPVLAVGVTSRQNAIICDATQVLPHDAGRRPGKGRRRAVWTFENKRGQTMRDSLRDTRPVQITKRVGAMRSCFPCCTNLASSSSIQRGQQSVSEVGAQQSQLETALPTQTG